MTNDDLETSESALPPRKEAILAGGRPRGWLWVTVAVAVLASVVGLVAGQLILSPRQLAAEAEAPVASLITAEVTREVIENTVVTRGTVTPEREASIGYGRLVGPNADSSSGDAVGGGDASAIVTGIMAEVGDQVDAGGAILEVSGRPVILLPGARAMYRDIRPGMTGPDVEQLQSSLVDLGYLDTSAVGGPFGPQTRAALERLYEDRGYTVPLTDGGDGSDAESTRAAEAAVKAAERALEDALTAHAAAPDSSSDRAVQRAREDLAAAQADRDRIGLRVGAVAAQREIVFVSELPAHVTEITNAMNLPAPEVLARVTPSTLQVTAAVTPTQASSLTVDDSAELDIDGTTHAGRVQAISGTSTEGTVTVTITPDEAFDFGLVGASVRVAIVVARSQEPVLTVPAGALSTDASGERSVILVDADETLRRVSVDVGTSGNGQVQITPHEEGALDEGDTVLIGG